MKWLERVRQILYRNNSVENQQGAMDRAIDCWSRLYRQGSVTGAGKLRLPAAIAGELARLAVCELQSEITGGQRAQWLEQQYIKVIRRLRVWAEYGFACGGMVLKPYPKDGGLVTECVRAECFTPLEYGADGEITAAEFREYRQYGGRRYCRVERHSLEMGSYRITNHVYDQGGREVGLSLVPAWQDMAGEVALEGIDRPLFVYFRTSMANSVDQESPLGVSVYAGAVELISQAEEQWERIQWEYKGGELAVDASEDLFEHRRDGSVILPEGSERLFRAHDIDLGQSGGNFLTVFSPALRDQSLFNGFNNIVRRIEFNCGLAYGTISDPNNVERTAQEIRSGKQRSYAAVRDLQRSLEQALEDLCRVMDIWATLEDLCPQGDWEVKFCWGDSIVVDSETLREQERKDVELGIMTKEEYRENWL